MKPTYFRPGTLHQEDGTIHHLPRGSNGEPDDGGDEWILIDSTPASCVQIGLYHYFQERGPIDVVVSGPNYGRNTTALFALSSGTIGGAMEGAVCGKRSIALSYAFSSRNHDPVIIAEASQHSVRVIEYLCANWTDGVDLYSVNVPLEPGVSQNQVLYTEMLENKWTSGSCFEPADPATGDDPELEEQRLRDVGEMTGKKPEPEITTDEPTGQPRIKHKHFKWAPNFQDVYRSVEEGPAGNDGWVVKEQMTRCVSCCSCPVEKVFANIYLLVSRLLKRALSMCPVSRERSSCEWNFRHDGFEGFVSDTYTTVRFRYLA